jgi:DHA1 family tetracycline resistance protein-like MFS transporter
MNVEGDILSPDVSLAVRGLIFGLLISTFCLAQFFSGPLLGALSDRKGRKKILSLTLVAAFISYILAATGIWIHSLTFLFLARILAGISAGNFAVAQSIIVDSSEKEDKAKNFGLIGMAWGAGFIIGPYFGGKLSDPTLGFNLVVPFLGAALLCLLNLGMVMWKLKETLVTPKNTPLKLLAAVSNVRRAFQIPSLRILFLVMFIFSFGWGFFTEFSPLFLLRRFEINTMQIANFYAYVGLLVAVCQGILIRPFLKYFSSETILKYALFGLGLVMPLMLIPEQYSGLFLALPLIALAESLVQPTASTLVSNLAPAESQGEMLGIHNSIQWAAIGIAPLFSGSLVALYPHLPITVCSCCMFLTAIIFLFFFKKSQSPAIN